MTAELVLLLSIYAALILGLFFDSEHGVIKTFPDNLPKLAARLERNVATGSGFYAEGAGGYEWKQ